MCLCNAIIDNVLCESPLVVDSHDNDMVCMENKEPTDTTLQMLPHASQVRSLHNFLDSTAPLSRAALTLTSTLSYHERTMLIGFYHSFCSTGRPSNMGKLSVIVILYVLQKSVKDGLPQYMIEFDAESI